MNIEDHEAYNEKCLPFPQFSLAIWDVISVTMNRPVSLNAKPPAKRAAKHTLSHGDDRKETCCILVASASNCPRGNATLPAY